MKIYDPELNKQLDELIHNFEEDFHARIENESIKYLDCILKEDIGFFLTDQGRSEFAHYICVQYFRTQKIKESVLDDVRGIPSVDTGKIWNTLSHIFATNVGWSIYTSKQTFKMILLKNQSSIGFITGDQPVINTYAIGLANNNPPEECEFYYPVSPKLAILISEKKEYIGIDVMMLSEEEVASYNKMIIAESHSQLYGASEAVLRRYTVTL